VIFESIACDWMSLRHEYGRDVPDRDGGSVLIIDPDGTIERDSRRFEQIRCPSSSTSIVVRCHNNRLHVSGNIGRFQHGDNLYGLTVMQCVERWAEVLKNLGYDVGGFGTRNRVGTVAECGTYLTRLDLAGNFQVSDYAALCSAAMVRRVGQKLPAAGKYGPTWGYDTKRSNWSKAKLYDKTAEIEGRRRGDGGATVARFELQLGSEYLKRYQLDRVIAWKDINMTNVIYGKFAEPIFRDAVSVEDWTAIPSRIRHWAVLWRDGVDLRTQMSKSAFYRARSRLMEYGIDVGTTCNVVALTRQCRIVEVTPIRALREAA
jgi:hypothetical protein